MARLFQLLVFTFTSQYSKQCSRTWRIPAPPQRLVLFYNTLAHQLYITDIPWVKKYSTITITGTLQTNYIMDDSTLQVFHFLNDSRNDILILQDLFLSSVQCIPVLRCHFLGATIQITILPSYTGTEKYLLLLNSPIDLNCPK